MGDVSAIVARVGRIFGCEPVKPHTADACKQCGGAMKPGKAIEQTYSAGSPDFPGDSHGMTMSPGGPGRLIDCRKCERCGWSVTAGALAAAEGGDGG